ncbi:hypothetical protein K1719_019706 [Acacia pycnantha]|nr:hypothetical protein K1719_019706 [Acacia pycnantha]
MLSPSSSPSPQQQGDEVQFSDDKHFALHGLITLLIAVVVFFLFIVFIIFIIPCLKRPASSSSAENSEEGRHEGNEADSNIAERRTASSSTRRDEDNVTQTPTQTSLRLSYSSGEVVISRKFPLQC